MDWKADWIWLPGDGLEINTRVLFRKTFEVKSFDRAELSVTADSRYRLCVNGRWVSDGPVRSFPWQYAYDRIDVTGHLQPGRNVIAVVVVHHGEGTFHHLVTRGGLLAQLEIRSGKRTQTVVSDQTWKLAVDPGYNRRSPRISCQMPHEEQLDARLTPAEWETPDFDDRKWKSAVQVAPAAKGPWENLTPRGIPLFEYEHVRPVRLLDARFVHAPSHVEGINLKRVLWPGRTDSNHRDYRGVLATTIVSAAAQTVRLFAPPAGIAEWCRNTDCTSAYLNGRLLNFSDRDHVDVRLRKGPNSLLAVIDRRHHEDECIFIADGPKPIELANPFGPGRWAAAGPFQPDDPLWAKLKKLRSTDKAGELADCFKAASDRDLVSADVLAQTVRRDVLPGRPQIVDPDNMLADNEELTVIRGGKNDIELLLDFGAELNAHVGFEIDAPAGVTLDANVFEAFFEGQPQWTWQNHSSFRYVTRQGPQRYLSFRHFGGRYLALTIRNLRGELRIRRLHALFVHNQVQHRGRFECSDDRLNRAWQVSKQTLLCCMEDTFTDCPTYEQTYWVGDARNEALICQAVFGEDRIVRRCCELPALSLRQQPLTVCQVPSAWTDILTAWSFMWVFMVAEYFHYSADRRTLGRTLYPAIRTMFNNIRRKFIDPDTGLVRIDTWNMFDWANTDTNHPITLHNSMFMVHALRLSADLAKALGKTAEAREWSRWADELAKNINAHAWSADRQAYVDSIHADGRPSTTVSRQTNTLALLYEIAPRDRARKIEPIVLNPAGRNVVEYGSPFAMFYLLECFAKAKRFDLIRKDFARIWGEMLDAGSTTFWEHWHSPSSGKYPARSYCHAWSAGPAWFLSRYVLGVTTLTPGGGKVLIQPELFGLRFARGTMPTFAGDIHIEWTRSGSDLLVELEIPEGIQAQFAVPDGFDAKAIEINGKRHAGSPAKPIRLPRTRAVSLRLTGRKPKR